MNRDRICRRTFYLLVQNPTVIMTTSICLSVFLPLSQYKYLYRNSKVTWRSDAKMSEDISGNRGIITSLNAMTTALSCVLTSVADSSKNNECHQHS